MSGPPEVNAPAAPRSEPTAAPAPLQSEAPVTAPVVTDFAWAKVQMQKGAQVKRAGWQGKTAFLSSSGHEVLRLPQGFPWGGAVVPWLYEPGDTEATDWEIAQ